MAKHQQLWIEKYPGSYCVMTFDKKGQPLALAKFKLKLQAKRYMDALIEDQNKR